MKELTDLKTSFLRECYEDYVGLWQLVSNLKRAFPNSDAEQIRSMTLELAGALLEEDDIRAGQFSEKGHFVFWELSPEKVIDRIHEEWSKLDREPNIGEIVWFIAE